jgi:hypothetical protein
MVLLLARGHGCATDFINLIKSEVQGCGTAYSLTEINDVLQRVYRPFSHGGGLDPDPKSTSKRRSKAAANCDGTVGNTPRADVWGVCTDVTFDEEPIDQGAIGPVDPSRTHRVRLSPNVLSLFVEKVLYPGSFVCSPPINHRPLKFDRLWCLKSLLSGEQADPGIVATLLGVGNDDTSRDATLAEMTYIATLYKVREGVSKFSAVHSVDGTPTLVQKTPGGCTPGHGVAGCGSAAARSDVCLSRPVFHHARHVRTNHVISQVTPNDLRSLVSLVSSVSENSLL